MSAELERRMSEALRLGVISEVRPEAGLCRVSFGGRVSPLSPWIALRAGDDRDFWHPDVGEQALFLSPYGDGSEGVVLVGVMSTKRPFPHGARQGRRITEYGDGTRMTVDREEHVVEVLDSYGSLFRMAEGDMVLRPARNLLLGK